MVNYYYNLLIHFYKKCLDYNLDYYNNDTNEKE